MDGMAAPPYAGPFGPTGSVHLAGGVRARSLWRLDRDPQTDAHYRHHPLAGRHERAGLDDLASRTREPRPACIPGNPPLATLVDRRISPADHSDWFGWLGQHQLRGTGLHGLPAVPRPMDTRDGSARRILAVPRAGRAAFR